MNIISPQTIPKRKPSAAAPILTLPFQVQRTTVSNVSKMMCPEKNITAYALFNVLEKQRIMKLRELYRQRLDAPSVNGSSTMPQQKPQEYGVSLPKLPPRYQNLNASADWLMLQLRKQRPTSQAFDEYKALDKITMTFLDDTVGVLQAQNEDDAFINNLCSKLCSTSRSIHRSSIAITPPSSPRRLPRVTLTEEEPPSISLSQPPSNSIHEVDLTDDQIISIYERSESSGDAVVLSI
mmetsp:Transcript_22020/g.44163  ORF Transcript_22020/g.44163 Transcript_22020/m.44163 type:complete len:237 (+) Transcript_22020:99-809(+)